MAPKRNKRPGEFSLIAKYFRPLAEGNYGALGLVDDAAMLRPPPGTDLVLTLDTIAANVHFAADDLPDSIARKVLRVNLSDLAAKGAEPVGYLLSLALPGDWTERWLARFAKGLAADQQAYGIALFGGDTTRASGGLTLTVTAIGRVPRGRMVQRFGAKPGDAIFVSGTIGDAALGLGIRRGTLTAPDRKTAVWVEDRYLHPQPRVALAPVLRRFATSAMDVSDGLVGDLAHICEVSTVGAEIMADKVPLSEAARTLVGNSESAMKTVLTGGDDYEILATVDPADAYKYVRAAARVGVPVFWLGRIVEKPLGPTVIGKGGKLISFRGLGHTHF